MTKKYDIRNLYVATIAKQGEVREYVAERKTYYSRLTKETWHEDIKNYNWDYSDEKVGIFVEVESRCGRIVGYKHVLTDTIYYFPTRCSSGQYVLKPHEVHELCKYNKDIAKHFIAKNGSYRITREQINYLEDRFNDELKADDELNV